MVLYETNELAYAEHEAVFEVLGGNVTLDLVVVQGLEVGAEGWVRRLVLCEGCKTKQV